LGNLEVRYIYRGLRETVNEGSGNKVFLSLSMEALHRELGGRTPSLGIWKTT
jgi:hypothetical protein